MNEKMSSPVKIHEYVKVVEYPDESQLIIFFTPEWHYENAIYIDSKNKIAKGEVLVSHVKEQNMDNADSSIDQGSGTNPAARMIHSDELVSYTAGIDGDGFCMRVPGPNGTIYIPIPPGTPC
jgi:hypothetical protein